MQYDLDKALREFRELILTKAADRIAELEAALRDNERERVADLRYETAISAARSVRIAELEAENATVKAQMDEQDYVTAMQKARIAKLEAALRRLLVEVDGALADNWLRSTIGHTNYCVLRDRAEEAREALKTEGGQPVIAHDPFPKEPYERMAVAFECLAILRKMWTAEEVAKWIRGEALKTEGGLVKFQTHAWHRCPKGSCHRHNDCMYTPCLALKTEEGKEPSQEERIDRYKRALEVALFNASRSKVDDVNDILAGL